MEIDIEKQYGQLCFYTISVAESCGSMFFGLGPGPNSRKKEFIRHGPGQSRFRIRSDPDPDPIGSRLGFFLPINKTLCIRENIKNRSRGYF